jgi:hypothetical protein
MRNTAEVTGGKPIAVCSQSISGVNAISPLVAFYDIHGRKTEVLFFYFAPDTTRDLNLIQDVKYIIPLTSKLVNYREMILPRITEYKTVYAQFTLK